MYLEDQRVMVLLRRRVKQYSSNPPRSNLADSQKDVLESGRSKVRAGTAPVGGARTGGTGSARTVDATGEAAASALAVGAADRAEKMRLSAVLLARKAAMRLRADAQQRTDKVEEALRRKAVQSEVR